MRKSDPLRPSWLRNAGVIAGIVLLSMTAFIAICLVAASTRGAVQRNEIEAAIADGSIGYGFYWPFGPRTKNYIYNFNDCLIFDMLVIPENGNLLSRAISPMMPSRPNLSPGGPDGFPPYSQCRDLKAATSAAITGKIHPSSYYSYYHRYLHGGWLICGILLGFLPVFAASCLLMAILVLQIGILALVPMFRAGHHNARGRDTAFATLAIVLAAFWAIPAWDWSFSFAPGDIVIVGFLLLFYFRPPSLMSEMGFVAACTTFGVLTAIFEFLTGGIPGGFAVLLAVLAFDSYPDGHALRKRAVLAIAAFTAAIILSFAVKMTLVAFIWGPSELFRAADVLLGHLGSIDWDLAPDKAAILNRYGITVEAIRSSRALSTLYGLFKMEYFTSNMAWGSLALGVAITTLAPAVLATRQGMRWKNQDAAGRWRTAILLLAAAVPLLWCCIFVQHTIASAHFMFRIMVWPPAVLLAAELQRRHATRALSLPFI